MDHAPTTDAAVPGPPVEDRSGRSHRKVRNYLLDAPLQLKLASYLLAVALLLSAGLGWLLWQAYRETSRVIALGDPDAGASIALALAGEDRRRMVLVAAALFVVLLCLLGAAVVITHRIAGPAFVIGRTCRQVASGDLTRPRPLRSRDLLAVLGQEAAAMVDALREREEQERAVALAVAATLRDADAGPAQRRAGAEALERLAQEKEGRVRS